MKIPVCFTLLFLDGNIDASIVKYTHFGGFDEEGDPNAKKSRNEIMKEVIAKSKSHKRERQKQKEEDLDLAEQVDADLEEIRGLLAPMDEPKPVPTSEGRMVISSDRLKLLHGDGDVEEATKAEKARREKDMDYDRFLKELAYDRRAKATDRTKTEEEIALEEKEELEKAEAARMRRMKGLPDLNEEDSKNRKKTKTKESRSAQADDLGDNDYEVDLDERVQDEEIQPLTYKNGVLVNTKIFMKPLEDDSDEESGGDESSDEGVDEGEGDEDEEGSDGDESADSSEEPQIELEPEFEELPKTNDDASNSAGSSEAESSAGSDQDALEDLYSGDEKEEGEEDLETAAERKSNKRKISEMMKEAEKELPFTFEAPSNLNDFMELIEGRSSEDQIVIIKRLRVLYSVKVNGLNKAKMEKLGVILTERIIELAAEDNIDLELMQKYQQHSSELCKLYPGRFSEWAKNRMASLRSQLNKAVSGRISGFDRF
jgi:nucleolar protein 14